MPVPSPKPAFIRPGKPLLCTSFRFRGLTGYLVDGEEEDPFERTVAVMLDWIEGKAPGPLSDTARQGQSFLLESYGQKVECVSLPEKDLWTLRYAHPDVGMGESEPAVAGRSWTYDLSVVRDEEGVHAGIQVICSSLPGLDRIPQFIRPGIIRSLAGSVGLFQVRQLDGKPWDLTASADLDRLESLLLSPKRHLPVFLVTQTDRNRWIHPGDPPDYLGDADRLARKTIGYAHVVRMPYALAFEWTRRVGKAWSAFDGAVRTYMPGLDFDQDSLQTHPLALKDRIFYWHYRDAYGSESFVDFLYDRVRRTSVRVPFSWDPLIFLTDARLLRAELQTEALRKGSEDTLGILEEQLQVLREKVAEEEDRVREWFALAEDYQRECEQKEAELHNLRQHNESLRQPLKARTGSSVDEAVEIPETFDELPQWVDRHLAGRLVLAPRAVRAIKSASYEEVDLVYRALLLLADAYRYRALGNPDNGAFEERCHEMGLRFDRAMTEVAAGEYSNDYEVEYPARSGRKRSLDFHLCKGSTKDDRYCLRIYFFWDETSQQVVVGWLPSHLRTRAS